MVYDSKKCENCGDIILGKRKKFCSSSCSATFNNKFRIKKSYGNCECCNKELKRHQKKYCSNACQGSLKQKNIFESIEKGELNFHEESFKRYMIQKHGAKCMECGWCEINKYTGKIPIQLEHVDGDSSNNKLENLKLLCPNCHTLTPTWGGANKGNGRKKRQEKRKMKE